MSQVSVSDKAHDIYAYDPKANAKADMLAAYRLWVSNKLNEAERYTDRLSTEATLVVYAAAGYRTTAGGFLLVRRMHENQFIALVDAIAAGHVQVVCNRYVDGDGHYTVESLVHPGQSWPLHMWNGQY